MLHEFPLKVFVNKIIWLICDQLCITGRQVGKPAILPLNSTWHFCRCGTLCKPFCNIIKGLDTCHCGEAFWSGFPIFSWADTGLETTPERRADLQVENPRWVYPEFPCLQPWYLSVNYLGEGACMNFDMHSYYLRVGWINLSFLQNWPLSGQRIGGELISFAVLKPGVWAIMVTPVYS